MRIEDITNNNEMIEFIKKYSYKKFINSSLTTSMQFDDLVQLIYLRLMTTIERFDSSKCDIKTYICIIINSVYKTELRKLFTQKNDIRTEIMSLDYDSNDTPTHEYIGTNFDIDNEVYNDDEDLFLSTYYDYLDKELDKKVLKLLYEGYTQKEIREVLCSTRGIIDKSIARIRKKLRLNLKLDM